jgi:hypothetical protein
MNDPNTALSLESVTTRLKAKQKTAFFDAFWKVWSTNGFGTLTKKDTDLLIFACLKHAFGESGPENNYQWAKLLRLTPTKVKSIRLESHLRFGHLFGESSQKEGITFLNEFNNFQSIDLAGLKKSDDIHDVMVSFVIEDPVVQMEIEGRLKFSGSYLDFHRNREVVKMRLTSFFLLLADEQEEEAALDKWVKAKAKDKAKEDGLIQRVQATEYTNKTESDKVKGFIDDLAKFGKVDVLTNHLKTIFNSQKERTK